MQELINQFLKPAGILFICVYLFSCQSTAKNNDLAKKKEVDPIKQAYTAREVFISRQLQNLSQEEKVGQLFILSLRTDLKGNYLSQAMVKFDEQSASLIDTIKPGGIILFKENLQSIGQSRNLIYALQQASLIPLFMGVDEEGGLVSRISQKNIGGTSFPDNLDIGKTVSSNLAYIKGRIIAYELQSLGFNMDFSPVADLYNGNPYSVIGKRSYGGTPELVAEMVCSEARGLWEENVAAVAKHFPGHGRSREDSHKQAAVLAYPLDQLREKDFIPFQMAAAAKIPAIMIGHIRLPEGPQPKRLAIFSSFICQQVLRKEFKYPGLLITDALDMGAVQKSPFAGRAALEAFKAGVDILLMPSRPLEAYQQILGALQSGEISEQRLDTSLRRILSLKYQLGLFNAVPLARIDNDNISSPLYKKMAYQFFDKLQK